MSEELERARNAGFVEASRIHGAEIERLRGLLELIRADAYSVKWHAHIDATLLGATVQPTAAPVEYTSVGRQYKFYSGFGHEVWRTDPSSYNGSPPVAEREIFIRGTTNPTTACVCGAAPELGLSQRCVCGAAGQQPTAPTDVLPHTRIEDCPTFFDGCNCTTDQQSASDPNVTG